MPSFSHFDLRLRYLFAKAQKIDVVAALSLAAGAVLAIYADVTVSFPLGQKRFPLALALPVVIALIHGYSLVDWWKEYSRASVRYGSTFRLRLAAIALIASSFPAWPTIIVAYDQPIATNAAILIAVAQISVVLIDEHYWMLVAAIGFLMLTLQLSVGPVAMAFESFYRQDYVEPTSIAMMFSTTIAYAILGPRSRPEAQDDF
jgi:hypothetical protein